VPRAWQHVFSGSRFPWFTPGGWRCGAEAMFLIDAG
jgi:hypothetical protein